MALPAVGTSPLKAIGARTADAEAGAAGLLRLISEPETRQALSIDLAADMIVETFRASGRGTASASTPSAMRISGPPHRITAKGAVLADRDLAGVRLASLGHPRTMLWRLSTGEPIALVDESWLYRFRTGVSAAVVAQMLLPAGIGTAAIVGAGPIAWEAARAICHLLAPERLLVAARRPESAASFARRAEAAGLPVLPVADAREAAREAELLVTITTADQAILGAGDLRRGATVLSMGGGSEFTFDAWQSAQARFVDDLDYALSRGDAGDWIARGETEAAAFEASLTGTVGDLALGRWRGRSREGETVMAIVQGFAALDIALASLVLERLGEGRAP